MDDLVMQPSIVDKHNVAAHAQPETAECGGEAFSRLKDLFPTLPPSAPKTMRTELSSVPPPSAPRAMRHAVLQPPMFPPTPFAKPQQVHKDRGADSPSSQHLALGLSGNRQLSIVPAVVSQMMAPQTNPGDKVSSAWDDLVAQESLAKSRDQHFDKEVGWILAGKPRCPDCLTRGRTGNHPPPACERLATPRQLIASLHKSPDRSEVAVSRLKQAQTQIGDDEELEDGEILESEDEMDYEEAYISLKRAWKAEQTQSVVPSSVTNAGRPTANPQSFQRPADEGQTDQKLCALCSAIGSSEPQCAHYDQVGADQKPCINCLLAGLPANHYPYCFPRRPQQVNQTKAQKKQAKTILKAANVTCEANALPPRMLRSGKTCKTKGPTVTENRTDGSTCLKGHPCKTPRCKPARCGMCQHKHRLCKQCPNGKPVAKKIGTIHDSKSKTMNSPVKGDHVTENKNVKLMCSRCGCPGHLTCKTPQCGTCRLYHKPGKQCPPRSKQAAKKLPPVSLPSVEQQISRLTTAIGRAGTDLEAGLLQAQLTSLLAEKGPSLSVPQRESRSRSPRRHEKDNAPDAMRGYRDRHGGIWDRRFRIPEH